ncbi:hypothetical protein [Sphingobium sp. YG1]|uniref:hypothetical protein n=1 Tax=Sphingobium sp. YG1 TaxID=2082188 RepID=UPI000DBB359F|nr:hypothetical protein [Sphingobium sp. YG1]BBC99091.1 hypothetical protein YGS_C1P0347 [Sphingobium sp. YG1]
MSAGVCIPDLIDQGKIPKGKGRAALDRYNQLLAIYDQQMGGAAAEALATNQVLKALENEAQLKARRTLLQVKAQQTALAGMTGYNGGRKSGTAIDPRAGAALLDRDGRASYSNVSGRTAAIRGRAHGMMDQILSDHSRNLFGQVRNRAQLEDIVREAFEPGSSGNLAAREMADAWGQTADMLRQRFNAAGGDIGKMEKWGMPQAHDSRKVRAAGFDAWYASIAPRLDRAKMLDRDTGLPFTDRAYDDFLRNIFETLRTDGWNKREAGGAGAGSMANRHSDSRFLIFKGADDWMAYQADFGAGTAFDAMMNHIDGLSHEIAAMEILGPNPNASIQWVKDSIAKSAALDAKPGSKAVDAAHAGGRVVDRLWDELSGASQRPENRTLALGFSALRSLQTAAKLGSATLSAVTDLAFQYSTRHYNGLPAAGIIRDYVKLLKPGSRADQKLAVRLGLIADEWSQKASAQGRYLNEELTGERARRLAEGVLRASGLSRWTQAGRWAFGMEFMGHLSDQVGKSFDALDPALQRSMARNGIDAGGWDKIRATPLEPDRGVDWLKPSNVEDAALGDRMLEMILQETDFAVPVADLRTRAMINSVAPRGTVIGEITRSALLFKSFGISMLIKQGQRIMEQSAGNAGRYAAGLVIGTTVMGAMAAQLKLVASGKDPRPMDDPAFWGAAVLQGGGFGIFGDFLSSTQNRFGGGLAGTLAGPLAQDIDALASIPTAKRPAWQAMRLARQNAPGGSLWYAKLAFDRLLTDQIQEEIDPDYRSAWRRMERRAREQKTQYYWAPGETAPDAPDFSNAFGESMQ